MGVEVSGVGVRRQGKDKNEPRLSSWFVFGTHWLGLPFLGLPLCISFPKFFVERERTAHIPLEREGTDASGLRACLLEVMSIEPTSLERGEGLVSGRLGVVEGKLMLQGRKWW